MLPDFMRKISDGPVRQAFSMDLSCALFYMLCAYDSNWACDRAIPPAEWKVPSPEVQ